MAYSRLASVEERRNTRNAVLFIALTIALGLGLFFFGVPILGKFTTFVAGLKKTKTVSSVVNDTTPPAPPQFDTFSEFTNKNKVTLTGRAEPGSDVKIIFNGQSQEIQANGVNGTFSFDENLVNGENDFSAIAKDSAGNKSQPTKTYKINFNNKPPSLTINSPSDGSSFFGTNQRQVTINGKTDPNVQVTINDRIVFVEDGGSFQFTTTLSEGQNKFTFKAADQAGNTSEKDITLSFSP